MKTLHINEPESTYFTGFSPALAEREEKRGVSVFFRNGNPIADSIPHCRRGRRFPHPVMSAIGIHYDPTEALNRDEWPEEDR